MAATTPNHTDPTTAEHFVAALDEQIASADETDPGRAERRRFKVRTVIERCGWDRRSSRRMKFLESLLAERNLHSSHPLTDPYLDVDDFIHFSRRPAAIPTQALKREADLVEYVMNNFGAIPPLNEYGSICRREFLLRSGKRVDLIIEDPRRRRWLLIEFKNSAKTAGTAGAQLIPYMHEVSRSVLPDGFTVEGMVISPPVDPIAIQMLVNGQHEAPGPMSWLTFNSRLELVPALGSVALGTDGVDGPSED
jgi:hypothetical protein